MTTGTGTGTGTGTDRAAWRQVGALVGTEPSVLDPVLLAIAEGTFAGDDRVTLVTAELKDPALAAPTARRFEIYGEHADGDMPSAA
ncbi:hypothetical protein SAMN02745830_04280 [Streptomyces sp. Amel2xC10]|nr:hypothetical protein SAMN02745830_04280 [Streptomyces sp. Amel2xC10]